MSSDINDFEPYKLIIEETTKKALAVNIDSAESCSHAIVLAKDIKTLHKTLEERRKSITKPLNDQVKHINSLAKKVTQPLAEAEKHIKSLLAQWELELEKQREILEEEARRKHQEEQARLQAEEDRIQNESFFNEDMSDTVSQLGDIDESRYYNELNLKKEKKRIEKENKVSGSRTVWKFEIKDESLIPRQYLIPDNSLIRAHVQQGRREIPGVRIYKDIQVSIKT